MALAPDALIARTAWLYSAVGANFLTTMLRLMGEKSEVRVVADQIGSPTSAPSLATALWELIEKKVTGMVHVTDAGVASWFHFAQAIGEEACIVGLLEREPIVTPIASQERPAPAKRPPFSVLDNAATSSLLGHPAPHWRVSLRRVLAELKAMG